MTRERRQQWSPTVKIEPRPEESRRSFLIRSCEANGWPRLESFLRYLGPALPQYRRAVPDQLAKWFGCEPQKMEMIADQWQKFGVSAHGVAFPNSRFSLSERKICPSCLAVDGYARFWWELDFITSCPWHGPLTSACACGLPLTWNDRELSCCTQCDAKPVAPTDDPVETRTTFEKYCLGRLSIIPATKCELLDELTLEHAVQQVEMLGLLTSLGLCPMRPQFPTELDAASQVREEVFQYLLRGHLDVVIAPAVNQYRSERAGAAPKVPANTLGWYIRFIPSLSSAPKFCAALGQALGANLGYPVTDLFRNDYIEAGWAAFILEISRSRVIASLHEYDMLNQCHGQGEDLYIPVELLHGEWAVRAAS